MTSKPFRKVYSYIISKQDVWVTIKDVAKATGISRPTATEILNALWRLKEIHFKMGYPAQYKYKQDEE